VGRYAFRALLFLAPRLLVCFFNVKVPLTQITTKVAINVVIAGAERRDRWCESVQVLKHARQTAGDAGFRSFLFRCFSALTQVVGAIDILPSDFLVEVSEKRRLHRYTAHSCRVSTDHPPLSYETWFVVSQTRERSFSLH